MKYESLIFDIDGTLWDSRALVAQGYNLQLRDEGLERYFVDAQRLRPLFGKVMTVIADELFPDLPRQERYALMEKSGIASCAYIGDTQGDLEATIEAGVPFLWAAYGFGTPSQYRLRMDSPEDLIRLEQEGAL